MKETSSWQAKIPPAIGIVLYGLAGSAGAFSGGLWGSLAIIGALLLFLSVWLSDQKAPWPMPALIQCVCCALAILLAETLASFDRTLSLKTWLHLASIFLPLVFLFNERVARAVASPALVPSVFIASCLGSMALGLELESGGVFLHIFKSASAPLTEYNRGIAHLAILAFPIGAGLWISGARKCSVFLATLLLFPAGLTESHTAKLALILGAVCTLCAFWRPYLVRRVLAVVCALLSLWPFYAQYVFRHNFSFVEKLPPSWRHRMEIWDFLSYRIRERPFLGWGLGTTHTLDFKDPDGDLYLYATTFAPHAHNFVVQTWVETGLPGLALIGTFLLIVLQRIAKLESALQPFALGALAASVTVALFGFDFWTDALWASFALSAFLFLVLEKDIKRGYDAPNIQVR